MAYFNETRGKWMYDIQIDGKRFNRYCLHPETKKYPRGQKEADEFEALIRAALINEARAEQKAMADPKSLSVLEAFAAYTTRKKDSGTWETRAAQVREMIAYFDPEAAVAAIDEQKVWDYINWARQQPIVIWIGGNRSRADLTPGEIVRYFRTAQNGRKRTDSTINRYLDCLRETLRIAYSLRDPTGRPRIAAEQPKVPNLKEPAHLPRPIVDTVLQDMIAAAPAHLADAILLIRLMGFRKAEAFALEVKQVDFQNGGIWLAAGDTKAERAEFIAASAEALALLQRLVNQARDRGVKHLITYPFKRSPKKENGKSRRKYIGSAVIDGKRRMKWERPDAVIEWRPIKNPKTAWRTLLNKLGLKGEHVFHNTKASFVTSLAHVASGAVVQGAARHKDYRTTQRYIKVADEALRSALEASTFRVATAASPEQESRTLGGDLAITSTEPSENGGFPRDNLVGAAGFEPTTLSPPEMGSSSKILIFKKREREE